MEFSSVNSEPEYLKICNSEMLHIKTFTFNPFQENTYVLSDSTGECIILDPGCYESFEKKELSGFISDSNLRPVKILLTHTHIDHILGNSYLAGKYQIPIEMSEMETPMLEAAKEYGTLWGIQVEPSPAPALFVTEGKDVSFGNTRLKVLFTPGHSPGSFSFYHQDTKSLFSGDVLFYESIGRTDLPGGDYDTLLSSIRRKLFTLPDDITVYPGHGPSTTIGHEKKFNPFLN